MPTVPHIFQDGVKEAASGVQVNENNAALEAVDATNTAAIAALSTLLTAELAGIKVRAGVTTVTWASNLGLSSAIGHGLGKIPTFATAVAVHEEGGVSQSNAFFNTFLIGIANMDATNVAFELQPISGVTIVDGATTKIRWIAVG